MASFKVFASLLLVFVCGAAAQRPGTGKCPQPPVQENFRVTEYEGKWYDYAHYFFGPEVGGKCIRAEYSSLPNGHIRVINSQVNFLGQDSSVKGEAYAPDPAEPAKLAVSFFNATQTTSNYWVLSTDYSSYSMVYSCTQHTSILHTEILWFLVRNAEVSAALKADVLKKFEALGLDTEPFIYSKQGPGNGCKE